MPDLVSASGPYTHAAVMGDIVSSQKADPTALYDVFNHAILGANHDAGTTLASPLTITLGDEFQGLCHTLQGGLALIRQLRARLRAAKVPCRFVLGVVRIETPMNTENAWNMMGPGLADTRAKLSNKRDPNAYRFHLPEAPTMEILLQAVGATLTEIEEGWTERQAEVVAETLDTTLTEPQLAEKFNVTRRAIYKVRSAARLDLYKDQWLAAEAGVTHLDKAYGLRCPPIS